MAKVRKSFAMLIGHRRTDQATCRCGVEVRSEMPAKSNQRTERTKMRDLGRSSVISKRADESDEIALFR